MFWIFKASNKCFLRYLVDTKEVKKVMIANKSKPIYLFFHILKISTLFGSDRKQLRTLLLKLAVRKFQEQANGKKSPKKEIVGKFGEVKQNDSKPNEK